MPQPLPKKPKLSTPECEAVFTSLRITAAGLVQLTFTAPSSELSTALKSLLFVGRSFRTVIDNTIVIQQSSFAGLTIDKDAEIRIKVSTSVETTQQFLGKIQSLVQSTVLFKLEADVAHATDEDEDFS